MVKQLVRDADPTLTDREVDYVLCWLELKRRVCHLARINAAEVRECVTLMRTYSTEFNDQLAATFDR